MSTLHDRNSSLTRRQLEILNCLVAAVDQNEAAGWLGISPTQVGRQKVRIKEALGAETFPQAVIIAHELGLIDWRALPAGVREPADGSRRVDGER